MKNLGGRWLYHYPPRFKMTVKVEFLLLNSHVYGRRPEKEAFEGNLTEA